MSTMRRTVAAGVAIAAFAPTAAQAAAPSPKLERAYQKAYDRAEHPGRNILKLGIAKPGPNRPANTAELRRSLGVLRRMTGVGGSGHSTASAQLQAIAQCESGGNPRAVDASGTYRGKYQFDSGTWASVGGHGDPAAAPEAEQDRRAQMLLDRAGTSPWPICGR